MFLQPAKYYNLFGKAMQFPTEFSSNLFIPLLQGSGVSAKYHDNLYWRYFFEYLTVSQEFCKKKYLTSFYIFCFDDKILYVLRIVLAGA